MAQAGRYGIREGCQNDGYPLLQSDDLLIPTGIALPVRFTSAFKSLSTRPYGTSTVHFAAVGR